MHPETTMLETSKVPGTSVYGVSHEEIGEVDDLIVDTVTGKVRYAVLSFGGFLGLGASSYVIPWTSLKWDPELNGYVTGITEEQLKLSRNLDPISFKDREAERRLHANYGAPGYWDTDAQRS